MGRRAAYVPGWDTHGLPIEQRSSASWARTRRELSPAEIRERCRDYALKFVDIQRTEFKRLGVLGNWDDPYLTLRRTTRRRSCARSRSSRAAASSIAARSRCSGARVDRTALAEAEIEYQDHTSPSVYVRFPLESIWARADGDSGQAAAFVIWTTTPVDAAREPRDRREPRAHVRRAAGHARRQRRAADRRQGPRRELPRRRAGTSIPLDRWIRIPREIAREAAGHALPAPVHHARAATPHLRLWFAAT